MNTGNTLQIKREPYHLLLLAGLILLTISFFVVNQAIDINLQDAYFVISFKHLFWISALILFVIWTLYKLTFNILFAYSLTWIHIVITIFTITGFVLISYPGNNFFDPVPRRYYEYSNSGSFNVLGKYAADLFIMLFVIAQLTLIANFIIGIVKRRI